MRLREYLELQTKNNKQLNEWSKGKRQVDSNGMIFTSNDMMPANIGAQLQATRIRLSEVYNVWKHSSVADKWKPADFDKYIKDKYYGFNYDLFGMIKLRLGLSKVDLDKSRTNTERINIIMDCIEEDVKSNPFDVLIYSNKFEDEFNGVGYIFYHPTKQKAVCWLVDKDLNELTELSLTNIVDSYIWTNMYDGDSLMQYFELLESDGWLKKVSGKIVI